MPLGEAVRAWIAQWVRLAEGDLAMARLGLESDAFDVFELVGFHAQQAAEKLIKALLVRSSVEFGDVHDLETLLQLVRGVEVELAGKLEPLAGLTRYAVRTRYPSRYGAVTREQAAAAVALADFARARILPLLGERGPGDRPSLRDRPRGPGKGRSDAGD